MSKDNLGKRMKEYESVSQFKLMRRQPVIIRLDGKAFHTFTKGFQKPFDNIMVETMQQTMRYLCQNIQGCVLGYTQSDEITLLLKDWQTYETAAWFDNKIQKMVSVSASLATLAFNMFFKENILWERGSRVGIQPTTEIDNDMLKYEKRINEAIFDSRAFNLSKEEVCNNFIWRQQDAVRNSIQSSAQSLFSHRQLNGINTKKLQDKMFEEKGVNWNDLPVFLKRGSCCKKEEGVWIIDKEIPIFAQEREYIENLI